MSRLISSALLGAAALIPWFAQAQPTGDPLKGKALFTMCAACHDATAGVHRIGPTLKGVTKRKVGTAVGYNYSPALKAKNATWTKANLDAYLAAPTKYAPGTRMPTSVPKAQDRADLIAYLGTLR